MYNYAPPFETNNNILNLVSKITKKTNHAQKINKQTRINSVHSSLAIENNDLTYKQVKDVINGVKVIGHQKDIQEVKNAYKAYEMLTQIDPYSINDLKKIHGIMTHLTIEDAGEFRKGNEGVFDGEKCIFICPPPNMLNKLMNDLFNWINTNKEKIHPLILSSVFHYEFVFIHPFSDGNGRTVRLWQNALLYKWKDIFEYLPIESNIHKYQNEYYKAISDSHANGNCTVFIEFMLKMINEALDEIWK